MCTAIESTSDLLASSISVSRLLRQTCLCLSIGHVRILNLSLLFCDCLKCHSMFLSLIQIIIETKIKMSLWYIFNNVTRLIFFMLINQLGIWQVTHMLTK